MSVRLVWMLDVDPDRIDEARVLIAERREQVRRHLGVDDGTAHVPQ
jgi:hypothetical protein